MAKELIGQLTAGKAKFAIVVSRFNEFITGKLLSGAIDSLGDRSEVSAAMRDAFLAEFSYRAHRPRMVELFESLAESPAPISPPVRQLLDTTEELYGAGPGTDSATPAVVRHRQSFEGLLG